MTVQRKLVTDRRGGYCFEHNTLLRAALEALGAEVEPILGRVGPRDAPDRARSHLLLRVRAEGQVWHADVGFGSGTLLEPIPFGPARSTSSRAGAAAWSRDGSQLVRQAAGEDGWVDLYSFVPEPVPFVDLETSNWFTSTHPRSRFVRGLVVTAHAADGSRAVVSDWSGTLRLMEQTPAGETVSELTLRRAGRAAGDALRAARLGVRRRRSPPPALSSGSRTARPVSLVAVRLVRLGWFRRTSARSVTPRPPLVASWRRAYTVARVRPETTRDRIRLAGRA